MIFCFQGSLPILLVIVLTLVLATAAAEEKRSVNVLLDKIAELCDGDEECSGGLMDDLIEYLYEGEPIGKKTD